MTIDWQYKASKWNKSPHKHNNLRYTSNLLKINIYEWKSQIYGKMMNQNLLHFDGRWRDDPASWGGLSQYNFVKICILLLSELVYSSTKPMTEVIVCESEPRCQEKHCEQWVSVDCWVRPLFYIERPPATLSTRQGLCVKDRRWWVDTPGQRRMAQRWR